ncbi:hypothetical protein IWX90DRAFT_311437 [Phyllosticta citrichinensis]|uniref:NAD(P)-binding protein n=1 Tax=Phyllosticta citrichinensis TaxID=1130410 RepID=A0ABR1XLX4_9PEZI
MMSLGEWLDIARNFWSQSFAIPAPPFTEADLPDQTGRVHIVTGGYAGVGQELATLLYGRNATVYIAGRNKQKAAVAIAHIEDTHPTSDGRLEFLQLDLADLSTIKKSVDTFCKREARLDVLTNNAGVMMPPKGSVTEEGYELQLGTNCIGPFLFSYLLLPLLRKTALTAPPNSVRVTWGASLAIDSAPAFGVAFDSKGRPVKHALQAVNYGQSKAGNLLLASEFARRFGHATTSTDPNNTPEGGAIVSVAWNPGNLATELTRHASWFEMLFVRWLLYPAKLGGYTELFAGWSPEVGLHNNGCLVVPWGRVWTPRKSLQQAMKLSAEGGYGVAERFYNWCQKEALRWVPDDDKGVIVG